MKQIPALILLALLAVPSLEAQDVKIDWRKLKIDCSRRRTKSKGAISGTDGEERREHITVTCTIKNGLKEAVTGLSLHVYTIAETASNNRRNRRPAKGPDKETKGITVEPNEKKIIEGIKATLVERHEWNYYTRNGQTDTRVRISGQTYDGYVAVLKDSAGKILLVKAEHSKAKKAAYALKILPKDLELDRSGVPVQPKK